jgi:hypothetical protein
VKYFSLLLQGIFLMTLLAACDGLTGVSEKSIQIPDPSTRFASGTKAVRINLSARPSASGTEPKGSFTVATTDLTPVSTPTVIPSGYPGYDGSSTYIPGASATYYYDLDGATPIAKPSWIKDIQVGFLNDPDDAPGFCSAFANASAAVPYQFQTSEYGCHGVATGTGGGTDRTFIRIILDRDQAYIGSKENLLLQLEYEATGFRLNPDNEDSGGGTSTSTNPETFVDQLWKVFSGTTLAATSGVPFSMLIPPNHGFRLESGQGAPFTPVSTFTSVNTVKQMVFPLASLTSAKYIQISRVRGGRRIFSSGSQDTAYYNGACGSGAAATNNPRCLGVVFRSITLIRI